MSFLIYAHTITQSCIKRARFEREINKKVGPGWGKFIDGRAVQGIDRSGAGNWGASFQGPPRPFNKH